MGCAAAYEASRRGLSVVLIAPHEVPNEFGGSHGHTRAFRTSYFEHPNYVPLLQRSWELWKRLELDSGEELLRVTGGLYCGKPEGEVITGCLQTLMRHELDHELLSSNQVRERFPQFRLPDDFVALYETQAGVLFAETCWKAFFRLAGVEHVKATVASVNEGSVTLDSGELIEVDAAICCIAGATTQLLGMDVEIVTTPQVMGWIEPRTPQNFAPEVLPFWGIEDGKNFFYGFPILPGKSGAKIANHLPGSGGLPGTRSFQSGIDQFVPGLEGNLLDLAPCTYDMSPDGNFCLGTKDGVAFGFGFSGHGFKFAPAIGEILVDFATGVHPNFDLDFLSVDRFTG